MHRHIRTAHGNGAVEEKRRTDMEHQIEKLRSNGNAVNDVTEQPVPEPSGTKDYDSNEQGKRRTEIMWKHPFICLLAGQAQCGKSTFTKRFLKYIGNLVDTPISQVIYCSPKTSQPDLSDCPVPVIFLDCIPNAEMFEDRKHRVVIIDDMMGECNDQVGDLLTKNSHHLSVSVIFISQNLFHRDISLNSHYIVAYKSPRAQLTTMARQIYPRNIQFMNEIFEDATSGPYGYLLMDLTQTTPDHLRFRTKIFPDDEPTNVIYVPKNLMI